MTTYKMEISDLFYKYGDKCLRIGAAVKSSSYIKKEDFALLMQDKKDLETEMDKLLSQLEDNLDE
jgi:hypothetical protein